MIFQIRFICGKMTEPLVQNSSSWNNTLDLKDLFMRTTNKDCIKSGYGAALFASSWGLQHLWGSCVSLQWCPCNDFYMLNLHFIGLIFTAMLFPVVCNMMVQSKFGSFMHCLPVCGRPLLMACICRDCYFAVVHPITYKTSKSANMIRKVIGLMVWMIVFVFRSLLCIVKSVYISSLISAPLAIALPVIICFETPNICTV